jgi:hypothetical protein
MSGLAGAPDICHASRRYQQDYSLTMIGKPNDRLIVEIFHGTDLECDPSRWPPGGFHRRPLVRIVL